MKHPERIVENETPFETGEKSTYMRYDAIEQKYRGEIKGFRDQVEKDRLTNKTKLATDGEELVKKLGDVVEIVARMWKRSEPHMRDNK